MWVRKNNSFIPIVVLCMNADSKLYTTLGLILHQYTEIKATFLLIVQVYSYSYIDYLDEGFNVFNNPKRFSIFIQIANKK